MNKRKALAQALSDRAATIRTSAGFLTDIGARVFRGKTTFAVEDLPCVVVIEGDDRVDSQQLRRFKATTPFQIEGHCACDPDNPSDAAHDMIEDMLQAFIGGDLTFGGLVDQMKVRYTGKIIGTREDGQAIVTAQIQLEIDMAFDIPKAE